MTNKIKIRAWDKKNKEMIYISPQTNNPGFPNNYCISFDGSVWKFNETDGQGGGGVAIEQKNLILLLYTGIKDKNGVDIYKGDIIEGIDIDGDKIKYPVIWYYTGWYVGYMDKDKWNITCLNSLDDIKIIGNIYDRTKKTNI